MQVLGTALQFIPLGEQVVGFPPSGDIDWVEVLLRPQTLLQLARQWIFSGLYAWALWLIAYAALAQPDRCSE